MAREAILGTDGLIHGVRPGTVVADASTIAPSESRRIGQALKAQGVEFLDARCPIRQLYLYGGR
jgi:3-hydroxyisobutyrate dehydrogenase-like beta-hydroxyacid dehydrogenase